MTATEELRRLLDERGVEWRAWDGVHPITVWHDEQCVYEYMERTLLDGVKPHTGEVVDGTGRLEAVIHVCSPEQAIAATLGETPTPPPPTPPKQPPYDELIESLRRDWDIEASWDGLRRFWYVGLTDEGVRKRDEREATLGRGACEVEAENAKLRELVADLWEYIYIGTAQDGQSLHDRTRELGIEVDE